MMSLRKGYIHTEETKRKIGLANKGKPFSGIPFRWTGKKRSEETKRKISEAHKGEKSRFWKGGISFEPYPLDWTDDLREAMRKRDDYICQICEIHQDELNGRFKKLAIHHIDYDKDNLDPKNLISLCGRCHNKTNFDRNYWIDYFKQHLATH
jgi:5-methylcytosine-specific restriction endonuclease McrA